VEQSAFQADIAAMDICLNELSLSPLSKDKYDAHKLMIMFAETAKSAFQRKIKRIQTDLSTDTIMISRGYSLHNWLFDKELSGENRNYREFLQGMISRPFISEEYADEYLGSEFYFEDTDSGISRVKCQGLAAAHITKTMSISFKNGKAWEKPKLELVVENEGETTKHIVLNISSSGSFKIPEINAFIAEKMLEEIGDSYLPVCETNPHIKECHITDDHGKDRLAILWDILKSSPYIESAMSHPFSPAGSQFIRDIEPNGETGIIVLSKDHPFTLRVKTTGRCYPETRRIAEILQEKYS
jgi:hypothetical protein